MEKNQPLRTHKTFLNGYNGIFEITNKNIDFIFKSVFEGVKYNVITIPPGTYDSESLDEESKIIIDDGYITEDIHFQCKQIPQLRVVL